MALNRRDFLTYGMGAVVVGQMPWIFENKAFAAVQVQSRDFTITDALKEMSTHNTGQLPDGTVVGPGNPAQCYFWIYKSNTPPLDAECPGPIIFATRGDTIKIKLTNALDEPHNFSIPALGFFSGPI